MVYPDGITDDLWRETRTEMARPAVFMQPVFQFAAQVDNAAQRVANGLTESAGWRYFFAGSTASASACVYVAST